MQRRRQILITAASAIATGSVVGLGASSTAQSSPATEFQVFVPKENRIDLTPAHDPPVHVQTNADGRVTALTPGENDGGINQYAITRFEDIVRVTNAGSDDIEGIHFDFEATSEQLSDATLGEIESIARITTGRHTLVTSGTDGDDLLAVSSQENTADETLSPGQSVPFGLQINLDPDHPPGTLDDLPDAEYELRVTISVN